MAPPASIRALACAPCTFALVVVVAGGAARAEPERAPGVLVPPTVVEDAVPVYPPDAFRDGVAGAVDLDLDINEEGLIARAAIVNTPDPRLGWAALGACTQMSFVPAEMDGAFIPVRVRYTLHFTIDDEERDRLLAEDEARALATAEATAPVNLKGRVRVAGEALDVAGAMVFIEDAQGGVLKETLTDEAGAFSLRGVPAGDHVIHVESSGFYDARVPERFAANTLVEAVLYLERKPTQNETVLREKRAQREVTKRTLSQKELVRVPGTFGDPIRVVQRLPGVQRAPFGLGAVLIRGGAPEDSTINIDGHLSRALFHLGAGPSVVNPDLVEELSLYPGGQGARYGRAIAGAVDVITRDPRLDTFAGKATVDLLQTGFRLEGPLPFFQEPGGEAKVGFFLAARTSYVADVLNVGNVLTQVVDLPFSALTLAPRYADYQAKLFFKLPARQTLSLNLFGSEDTLTFALDASQLPPQAPSRVGIGLGFHRFNPVWRITSPDSNTDGTPKLSAFISPMVEMNHSENTFDTSEFRLDVKRASLRSEVELRPIDGLGLLLGIDHTAAEFLSTTDVPTLVPNERLFPRPATSDPPRFLLEDTVYGTSYAFYAEGDMRLGPILFIMGGRADLWTYYDEVRTVFDPRFTARMDLLHHVTAKASLGRYHQTATPFELAQKFGNPGLPLEMGWQGSGGVEVDLTDTFDLDVLAFFRRNDDLANFVVSPVAFFASGAARVQPTGEERVMGAELLLRQRPAPVPWGKVFGWVAYTLMRAEERADPSTGVAGSDGFDWRPNPFDQTHIVSIAVSTELPWQLEFGASFRYVTGNPATIAQGGIFDADTSRYQRVNPPPLSSRLPDFIQVDLRVDKRFTFDTWQLGLFCDLQNATNQQNYEFFAYNYDFTQVQGFPGLPILPVVGVEASF